MSKSLHVTISTLLRELDTVIREPGTQDVVWDEGHMYSMDWLIVAFPLTPQGPCRSHMMYAHRGHRRPTDQEMINNRYDKMKPFYGGPRPFSHLLVTAVISTPRTFQHTRLGRTILQKKFHLSGRRGRAEGKDSTGCYCKTHYTP